MGSCRPPSRSRAPWSRSRETQRPRGFGVSRVVVGGFRMPGESVVHKSAPESGFRYLVGSVVVAEKTTQSFALSGSV